MSAAPAPATTTTTAPAAAPTAAAPAVTADNKFDTPEFDEWVKNYDAGVRRFVLGYSDLHHLATIAVGASRARNVLVVGCGTGQEVLTFAQTTKRAADAPAAWRIVGCDPSEKMIAAAFKRCAAAGVTVANAPAGTVVAAKKDDGKAAVTTPPPHVELHACFTHQLPAAATGFDAALSVLVMHMLPDDDTPAGKAAYLAAITARLAPGARYLTVDGTVDRSSPLFAELFETWLAFGDQRPDATFPAPLDAIRKMWSTAPGGSVANVTEARMVALLEAAGFVDVQRVYQGLVMQGFVARYQPKTTAAAAATATAAAK